MSDTILDNYDCSGWVTKHNVKCSDGRIIAPDAFKHHDGQLVPLVWNHNHDSVCNILGNVTLENKPEGVYGYCKFNDTELGLTAKKSVEHGDIVALSILANQLQQQGNIVTHGMLREVSLVVAGRNPSAYIESVIKHGECSVDEAVIYSGDFIDVDTEIQHSADLKNDSNSENAPNDNEETLADIFNSMTEKQQNVTMGLVANALDIADEVDTNEIKHGDLIEGGNINMPNTKMKHNVFDKGTQTPNDTLTHSDLCDILNTAAKTRSSFKTVLSNYVEDHSDTLAHGFDNVEQLFPAFQDLKTGSPELVEDDSDWINVVIKKATKSPIARIRTRQADARSLRAIGYNTKGSNKKNMGNIQLITRTTDACTVYVKDALHRDDILDNSDFDIVPYVHGVMRKVMKREIAIASLVGDGREQGPDKIDETRIRPVWLDDELFTIHVDINNSVNKLQGNNTTNNFGDNFIFVESLIETVIRAKKQYKGSGKPDFYCSTDTLTKALLARDLNGRRLYESASDLAKALNVGAIYESPDFDNLTRKTDDDVSKTKKLIGLCINMADYNYGAVKNGKIGDFQQFDIDCNLEKMLLEIRLSGALTKVKSAIAIEEDVTPTTPTTPVDENVG